MHSGLPIVLPGADGSLFMTWGDATTMLEHGLEVRLQKPLSGTCSTFL